VWPSIAAGTEYHVESAPPSTQQDGLDSNQGMESNVRNYP
jgi:hypothetical protein